MNGVEVEVHLRPGYNEPELRKEISKKLKINSFSYQISYKSLDARKKQNIFWLIRAMVTSSELKGKPLPQISPLEIAYKKRNKKIFITGSGPAGFFAAYVLQKAGFSTTIIERGTDVYKREAGIREFETTGTFHNRSNYSFGEGGAGTFSDGKLTSRSKHISKERDFVLTSYVQAGAPPEILYLAHPHVGSDNLKVVVKNLRKEYQKTGGIFRFETTLNDIQINREQVEEAICGNDAYLADYFIVAPGHSAFDTYRMLMKRGVQFRPKSFALGCRVEHRQEIINRAQWGVEKLPGVKAAEYRLTSNKDDGRVYTFCMCPGGIVVPAAAYPHTNIVNGMSYYLRDNTFANAACVAAIHPDQLAGKEVNALEALDYLENLEHSFFEYANGFKAPFCSVQDFLREKEPKNTTQSSYPLGLIPAPLWKMLPSSILPLLKNGLQDFSNKIQGYDTGNMIGLESKTSSPIQAVRDRSGLCEGFDNLFLIGEGSGYAGGIISSAADGVRTALSIIEKEK